MLLRPIKARECQIILVPSIVRQGQPSRSGQPIIEIVGVTAGQLSGVGSSIGQGVPDIRPVGVGSAQPTSVGDVLPNIRGVDVRDLIPEREQVRSAEGVRGGIRGIVENAQEITQPMPGRANVQGALDWQKGRQAIKGGSRPIRIGVGVRF